MCKRHALFTSDVTRFLVTGFGKEKYRELKSIQELLKLNHENTNLMEKWVKELNRHLTREENRMANEHANRCFTSHVTGKTAFIKTMMRYPPGHLRKGPKARTPATPNARDVEQQKLPFSAGANATRSDCLGRQFGGFLQN